MRPVYIMILCVARYRIANLPEPGGPGVPPPTRSFGEGGGLADARELVLGDCAGVGFGANGLPSRSLFGVRVSTEDDLAELLADAFGEGPLERGRSATVSGTGSFFSGSSVSSACLTGSSTRSISRGVTPMISLKTPSGPVNTGVHGVLRRPSFSERADDAAEGGGFGFFGGHRGRAACEPIRSVRGPA